MSFYDMGWNKLLHKICAKIFHCESLNLWFIFYNCVITQSNATQFVSDKIKLIKEDIQFQ